MGPFSFDSPQIKKIIKLLRSLETGKEDLV